MASGKFLLRMDESLHEQLQITAEQSERSLNELCCVRLELPSYLEHLPSETISAIRCAQMIAGKDLVGIVMFGSWARGVQRDGSDLDLLIVLRPGTPITRSIYRRWEVIAPDLKICEPNFVSLPKDEDHTSGLWAEIAIDGIVFIDTNQSIVKYLSRVRRAIVEGRLISKRIHGQNYWIHTEVA